VITVALKGLAGRKLRAALTALAIVLGVAMVSGTYILTDTITKAFDNIFRDSYTGTSVVISGKKVVEFSQSGRATVPESLLDEVKALESVEAAAGGIQDTATILGKDGEVVETMGAPNFGFGVDASQPRFSPLELTNGRWPTGPDEVLLDAGTAEKEGLRVGDRVGVSTRKPVREFELVGIARFGSVSSIGSATFAVFDIPTAQDLFDKEGQLDGISIAAREGVTPEQLVQEIRPILPPEAQVQTAEAQAEADAQETTEGLSILQQFLLAFGAVALFVGAFVIFNTLSITVAQRSREFATMRTIGASRRQVLASVILEALVIGVLASVLGLFLGLGLARGLNSVFEAAGIDLPQTRTVFATRTVVVSLAVGIGVTLLAGLFPAIRATRVPPIAAVREGAVLPRSRLAPLALPAAALAIVLGTAALAYGMFADGVGTTERLYLMGAGCLILFCGVALLSPRLVRPLAAALGLPAGRLGGAAGEIARENSMRNPTRTAVTAAALMIGLALVTFVAVLGQGLRASLGDAIDRQIDADYVVTAQDNFSPVARGAGQAVAAARPVEEGASVGIEQADVGGSEKTIAGVDADLARFYQIDWTDGSDAVLGQLGDDGAIVQQEFADENDIGVGDSFTLQTPQAERLRLVVRATYEQPEFSVWLGDAAVSRETFDDAFPRAGDAFTFLAVSTEPSASVTRDLQRTVEEFPDAKVQTKAEFSENQSSGINLLLNLLYVLLALSVIISLFGMVNTLALSVFERTRELGLLRAVGMTRWQARQMVAHESVITALIGAALGMPLGIFLAALVTQALESEGVVFSVPAATLVVFAVIAVLAGILAAILPARRAARLNVLEALQYE
jgi:putative ABC transport system permease protein